MNLIDEEYTRHSFYGVRRITKWICIVHPEVGPVNHKRIARLMRIMGLKAEFIQRDLRVIPTKRIQPISICYGRFLFYIPTRFGPRTFVIFPCTEASVIVR